MLARLRSSVGAKVAAALAVVAGAIASTGAAIVAVRWARFTWNTARFVGRVFVLRAYRRCPACYRVLRREASVCRSCGAPAR